MTWNERVQQSNASEYDGLKARCEAAEARADALRRVVESAEDKLAQLIGDGCPDDLNEMIVAFADLHNVALEQVERLKPGGTYAWKSQAEAEKQRADALAAELAVLREVIDGLRRALTPGDSNRARLVAECYADCGNLSPVLVLAELDRLLALRATVAEGKGGQDMTTWMKGGFATSAALLERIRIEVAGAGSQDVAAKRLGVSAQYLCDVLKGRREPGKKLLDGLGYRRVVVYEQIRRQP